LESELKEYKERNSQLNTRLLEVASKLSFCSGITCSDDEEEPKSLQSEQINHFIPASQPTVQHWKKLLDEMLFEHSMRISNRFFLAASQIHRLSERVNLLLKSQPPTHQPISSSHSTLQQERQKLLQDCQTLHQQVIDLQSRLGYSEGKSKDFERESHFLQRKLQVKEVELESLANTLDSLRSQFQEAKEAYAQDSDSLKRQVTKYKGAISALKESLTVAGEKLARYKRRWNQDQQRIKNLQFQKAYLNGIALEFRECEKTMARIMIAGVAGAAEKKVTGAALAHERLKGLFAVGRAVVKMKQCLAGR
jgi:chromosome segregation ATPase